MKKLKRNILRLTIGIIIFIFLVWLIAYILVHRYKDDIHRLAVTEINRHINGNVTLGSFSPSFSNAFPHFSVSLSDVVIRDSLWDQHHHDLIIAEHIYITFTWKSLFRGKPEMRMVTMENGKIHIYTDANGYTNLIQADHIQTTKLDHTLPDFSLRHTRFVMENKMNNSFHDIDADFLHCQITKTDSIQLLHIRLKSTVHGIGFNLEKGSYLSEKSLKGNFDLIYFPKEKIVIRDVNLDIADHPILLNGNIFLQKDTMSYDLIFQTSKIEYQDAAAMLTQSLRKNVTIIDIDQPIDIEAHVAGQIARKVVPRIITRFAVKNAGMETPIGHLDKCTYSGTFINQVDTLSMPGDPNSKFTFNDVNVEWNNIPLTSTKIVITNLITPILKCDIASEFSLTELNTLSGSSTIQFLSGKGNLDITYQGLLPDTETKMPVINGTFYWQEAEIHYLPRDLLFKKCNGEVQFKEQDLVLKNLMASIGNSEFSMSGKIQNLLAMINLHPEQLSMDLHISAPSLVLEDFISYVRPSAPEHPKPSLQKNKIVRIAENADRMLRDGTARLNVNAGEVLYKKFKATQVKASIKLDSNKINLEEVSLRHANGSGSLKGTLINRGGTNTLNLTARINSMDIPLLFKAFDNFGQDAVTSANTRGLLTANIELDGEITDRAVVKENSMKGTIDFSVIKGELNQFEPLMKITEVAFKKRDFSQIKFAELRNQLVVDGSAYNVQKMEIRSNVVVLFVEGVYDTRKGTDMSIQVPLSNLSREENDIMENKGKAGMNIRLRARTGEDGKLKVSWDPLNVAGKQRKAALKKDAIPASGQDTP